jgi:hypothetical protein
MCHSRCPFTEDSEQSLAIESQAEPVLRRKCGQLLLPIVIVSGADVFQVVFEKSAVLVLVQQAVLPCAVHRALHLFGEHCWRFYHLSLSRCRQVIALPFCCLLHCKICDASRTAPRVVKDAADLQTKTPIFAKQKARNVEHEIRRGLTKAHKGAKYGIPNSSCRRINDGALCADHRRLPETARMVTLNRR